MSTRPQSPPLMSRLLGGARLALDGALDLIYPPRCLICEAWDAPVICETCAAAFISIPEPICALCGRPVEDGAPCRHCAAADELWGGWSFARARAAGVFSGPLRRAVHVLKYDKKTRLGPALGAYLANRMLADGLLNGEISGGIDAVAPMPSSLQRERERGFNPATLLAVPLADGLGAPIFERGALRRVRQVKAQVRLAPDQRRRNVNRESFAVDADMVVGKRLLIVDDVFTTGASVQSLAAALMESGASRVVVATLAAGG